MKFPGNHHHSHNFHFTSIGLVIIFLILAFSAHFFAFFALDLRISHFLQSFQNPFFSQVMNIVSEIGNDFHLELVVGVGVFVLIYTGNKLEAFKITVSSLVAVFLGSLSKKLIGRPRPGSDLVTIQELLSDKSFPSLHVILYTVVFGYIIFITYHKVKNYWLKYLVIFSCSFLILTIGLSRIYLGAHWASDTVGGYVLGTIILLYTIGQNKKTT